MRYIALALSLVAGTAFAQQPNGIINAPIYATGYISVAGGTNVATKIPAQPNHPANQNVYLTSAVTGTWTIQLPNPAFEGQVLSFNCGDSASTVTVTSTDGSSLDASIPTSCNGNSGFVVQFDQRNNIWRNLGSNTTVLVGVTVNNNTQLTALPSSITVAVRLGFAAAGDAPATTYTRSNSACSLNAGAGDGGSQVPTSDGKCWIGQISPSNIDVTIFGASKSVSADATAQIQAAINYAGTLASSGTYTGAVVHLPAGEYLISSTLTISNNNVTIEGDGKGITIIARNAAFADTIRANNNGQIENISVRHLTLYHDIGVGNAMTGAHVNFIGVTHGTVDDVNTINGLIGIELQGGVYLTVKNTHIQGTYVSGSTPKNGLSGLWITAAPSLNVSGGAVLLPAIVNITETQINSSSADAGWRYGHLINAAEEVHFSNSTFNGSYYAQGYIQQTASNYDILEITYANCFFDGGSTPSVGPWFGLWVDGSAGNGSAVISRITIDGTSFNGEGLTPNGGSFGNGFYRDWETK